MKLGMCEWEGSPLAVIVDVACDGVLRACRAWHRDRVMSADIDAAVAMLKDEQVRNTKLGLLLQQWRRVLFCSSAVLDPRVGHTVDVLSPFIAVLYHSD